MFRKNVMLSVLILLGMAVSSLAATLPTDTGSVTMTLKLTASGNYKIWSRLLVPNATSSAFWLQIDDGEGISISGANITPNTWTWVNYRDGSASSPLAMELAEGVHTVKLIGQNFGVKIDRLIFTPDNIVPSGNGDNCLAPKINSDQEIKAYPQPARDSLHLAFAFHGSGRSTADIYTLSGEKALTIKDTPRESSGQASMMFNTAKLAAGVYLLMLSLEDQAGSRMIKKRIVILK